MGKKIVLTFLLYLTSFTFGQTFENFISVDGYKLMDGDKQYRFLSFNIPNLNFVEDNMDFTTVFPYRFPTEFEIRDALESVKQMGGQVVRIYTLPVRNLAYPDTVPAHITGPGEFNEEAFKVNDLMLAVANEVGVRIIFSFLNEWKWLGGRPQYAAFRGKEETEFYTDRQLIEDFKKTIEFTVNRTNTITGVKYKDDKSIMCWETGNELLCPFEWTREITRYIKSMDKNHLILDGYHAMDARPVREESVEEWSIDLVHSHHYEIDPMQIFENIDRNLSIVKGRKPYILGEFGFHGTTALEMMIEKVISTPEIAGALTWSLRFHRDEGGFYWHSEPLGFGRYKAYHWPGFSSGTSFDETEFLAMFREKAFEIQGMEVPAVPKPKAPELLPVKDVKSFWWKGSAGASGYHIQRTDKVWGKWTTIGFNVSDADAPYFPLFHDKTAKKGKEYYYRVKAVNSSGCSDWSEVNGPVKVESLFLVDNMLNYGRFFSSKDVELTSGNDRRAKEKINRMKGNDGSEIVYRVNESIKSVKVYSFEDTEDKVLKLSVSADGKEFTEVEVIAKSYHQPGNNYGYFYPVLYSLSINEGKYNFIKISFTDSAELARVEVVY